MPAKVRLGKAPDWSVKDIEKLSQISEQDMKLAKALWQRNIPGKLGGLLAATPLKDKEKKSGD